MNFRKMILASVTAVFLIIPVQASAYFDTFFGEDLYPDGSVTGATESWAASQSFRSDLTNVGVLDFESHKPGTSDSLSFDLGAVGSGTMTGSMAVNNVADDGRFAISGTNYLEVKSGEDLVINLSGNVNAFGFWGTDISEFFSQITVTLSNGEEYSVPHSLLGGSGSAMFWGIIDTENLIESITISSWGLGWQTHGLDDFYFGNMDPVVATPEPSTFALLGLSLLGLAVFRKKIRK